MSESSTIMYSIENFDDMQCASSKNTRTVNAFVRILKHLFHEVDSPDFCKNSFFIRYGSNRERTVVTEDADFDLIMVLPYPYTLDCFYPADVEPGVFTLNLERDIIVHPNELLDQLLTRGYPRKLRTQLLRRMIFDSLKKCVAILKERWTNWQISCREFLTNFKVFFNNGQGRNIIIDLIPQIGIDLRSETIPGCNPSKFPEILSSYIDNHNYHAFYVLAFPTNLQNSPKKHLFVQLNFGLLELSCIEVSDNIRDTVRMCKAISLRTGMRDLGLCHYHIKRKSIQYFDDLEDEDPYDGVQIVFKSILRDLQRGFISGYFIPTQNMYTRKQGQRIDLCDLIDQVLDDIKMNIFSDYLNY